MLISSESIDQHQTKQSNKYYYFASDLHLGVPNYAASLEREKRFVSWLNGVAQDAIEIYLLGDIFDFWFEYRSVVPKGYTRLLGKLAELTDAGIPIHVFAGNHDMWYRSYFPIELSIQVHFQPITKIFFGKKYFLAHGDGIGPGDTGYKVLKKILRNPITSFLFRILHPDLSFAIANSFSATSRNSNNKSYKVDYGERERHYLFVANQLAQNIHYDYYIFGHRHNPQVKAVGTSTLIVLGDWISDFSYLKVGAASVELKQF